MSKHQKYSYLKISVDQLLQRLATTYGWAFQDNAWAENCIITTQVGVVEGEPVYQQFERRRDGFHDLGLCTR